MSLIRPTVIALTATISLAPGPAAAQSLPTDPSLTTGQLDNGLRYIVQRHAVPPGKAMMWVHIHSGSLNETDRQSGIAHYLEHMAFNGSTSFAPGTLVPFFQSLGMTFGRDQNAFTNLEQTTYQLTLPKADPDTLGKGMAFFSDVVSGLSLLPTEIDAERQIILEERRRGLSGRQRTGDYIRQHLTPGSLYAVRDTIGTEETIKGVNQNDFRDYYGNWYSASNATLMVVADADPASVVQVIRDKFSAAPKRPRPMPQALNVKATDKSFGIVATDPEVRSEEVRITRVEPARPTTTTIPQFRADLVARLGVSAMNRRLSEKVARGGTSYSSANVSIRNDSAIYTAGITGRANAGKWEPALNEIALELQRGRTFGFTARELDDVKKEIISSAERDTETEVTLPSSALIARLNGDITTGEPTMSSRQRLDLLNQILSTITADEVGKRFAQELDPKAVAFIVTLPTGPNVPSESQLLEIGLKALAVKPTPETETAHATTLMTELPKPGKVAEGADHAATKVWSGWLSNNARVHYRFMDQRKDEVSIQIALIGGGLLETGDNRGVTDAAQLAWSRAATQHLSSTDIRAIMTGKKVSVRGGGGFGGGRGGRGGGGGGGGAGDGLTLSVSGSPEELESGLQLAYLLLTEPRIEETAFTQHQTSQRENLQESGRSPQALAARLAAAAPYPDNEPRHRPITAEQIDKLTLAGAQAWLDKLIKESPIEIVIVGDIAKDRALDLAARYLGALPTRNRITDQAFAALRKIERPKGARIIEKAIDTKTDQAYVQSGFYGADEANRADARALSMAARILSTRMVTEVREKAQLVYSIGASSRAATTYPGFGIFSAGATTDPTKVTALTEKLAFMYQTFAASGPTDDEMAVAKKQFTTTFDDQLREPGFWSGRLSRMTFRGATLDDIAEEPDAMQALTAEQVKSTFARYYSKDNAIVVVVKPSGKAGAAAEETKGQ